MVMEANAASYSPLTKSPIAPFHTLSLLPPPVEVELSTLALPPGFPELLCNNDTTNVTNLQKIMDKPWTI